jgi:hypothetical protein
VVGEVQKEEPKLEIVKKGLIIPITFLLHMPFIAKMG